MPRSEVQTEAVAQADADLNRKKTAPYSQGCFVDSNGYVRDVANPGHGMSCKVTGNTVELLAPPDSESDRNVIDECTFYPSLEALAAIGFKPSPNGQAVPLGE